MKIFFLLLSTSLLLAKGCGDTTTTTPKPSAPIQVETQPEPVAEEPEVVESTKIEESPYKSMIFNTKLSISPTQPNWVLFENGTYIILPANIDEEQMKKNAIVIIKRYKGETLSVKKSPLTKGWVASSTQGIYNYVSLEKAGDRLATDQHLKTVGKNSILKDVKELNIVHVNTKK